MHKSGLQLAMEVSDFVAATFLGRDPAQLHSKDPHKLASFRALCQHPALQMGAATLNRLVRIGHQVRRLPPELAESLSPGHHRALLAVDNAQHKQHLARHAVQPGLFTRLRRESSDSEANRGRARSSAVRRTAGAPQRAARTKDARREEGELAAEGVVNNAGQEGWNVKQLEAVIAEERPPNQPLRGRPPLSRLVKWSGSVQRERVKGGTARKVATEFAKLKPDEQAKVRAELVAWQAQAAALLAAIGA
jgi:hypothetical protein